MRAVALIVAALLLVLTMPAAQAQRSQADCEKLSGDDAYNRCLASFGPRRGERARGPMPQASEGRATRRGDIRRGGIRRDVMRRGGRGINHAVIVTPLKGGRLRLQIMPGRR